MMATDFSQRLMQRTEVPLVLERLLLPKAAVE